MKLIFLLLSILLLSACAQQFAIKPDGFDRYDVALVEVKSNVAGTEEHVLRLTEMIVDDLNDKNIFQTILSSDESEIEDFMRINIVIMHVNQTPDVQRLALGKNARSNEVSVQVFLLDNVSQQALSAFQLQSYSPTRRGISVEWPWGSVDEALQKISDQLLLQLASWR